MVKIIIIKNQQDMIIAAKSLNRVKKRLPIMTRESMRKWGRILERDMKQSARRARIKAFTGTLFNKGIEWRQGTKSDHGHLFMRIHGIYLDSMKPHYVNITRRRTRLLAWALKATSRRISRRARMISTGKISKYAIKVKPHPFIRAGYRRARPKLNTMLKRMIKRTVK